MKNFKNFLNEKLNNNQQKYIDLIINYLKNNTDFELYEYNDEFIVDKKENDIKLIGKLYLFGDNNAIRFNFDDTNIHSIDMWENFEFDFKSKLYNNPSFTMYVDDSIVQYLDDVVDFINGDITVNEDVEVQEEKEHDVDVKTASDEKVTLKNLIISKVVLEENMDIFTTMNMLIKQVAFGISNSLIITGGAGLGKTSEVKSTLKEVHKPYELFAGDITTAGLYETIFLNRDKLIVFDDCDSVFKDKPSLNILKAALDTYPEREISRVLKTYFDSSDMTDDEIQLKYEEEGKLPKQFVFTGQIIFISNLEGNQIDKAVVSRSLHVDVDLNREEVLERMRNIMQKLYKDIPMNMKEEALEFIDHITSEYPTKFDLNIRTLIHSINIRVSNDKLTVNLGGTEVPAWQMLIKQYLVDKDRMKKNVK